MQGVAAEARGEQRMKEAGTRGPATAPTDRKKTGGERTRKRGENKLTLFIRTSPPGCLDMRLKPPKRGASPAQRSHPAFIVFCLMYNVQRCYPSFSRPHPLRKKELRSEDMPFRLGQNCGRIFSPLA